MNNMVLLLLVFFSTTCACSTKVRVTTKMAHQTTAPFIIYKTRADYSQLVPVLLTPEKDRIVSYPAPGDLKNADGFMYPVALRDSFFFDQRGIGPNVAFTSFTYEQYYRLEHAPSLDELDSCLIDRDPLVAMYNCSAHSKIRGNTKKMNRLVKDGFQHCNQMK